MICLNNLSQEEIQNIGHDIANAFLSEPGCFSVLDKDVASRMFAIIVETCYETGHLYTTSEKQEGYCVHWSKKERPGFFVQAKMVWKMITQLPLRTAVMLKDSQNQWKPTEVRYKHSRDFEEVFLLVVRKDYQGQGYFREMLEEVFDIAKSRGTITVLDTDSINKANKYEHVGMTIVDRCVQQSGIEMFALEK